MLETKTMPSASERPEWPDTFRFGEFVRLVRSPQHWGRIVCPSELPDRWVFEYPHGARITDDTRNFEPFEPTALHRKMTDHRFEFLAETYAKERPQWPERYMT